MKLYGFCFGIPAATIISVPTAPNMIITGPKAMQGTKEVINQHLYGFNSSWGGFREESRVGS